MKKIKPLGKSAPHRLTWVYYHMMTDLINEINSEDDNEKIKQKTVLTIFLALNLIETFINSYFRLVAERIGDPVKKKKMIEDINKEGIEWKIKNWPGLNKIDYGKGIGQKFKKLKGLRNDLVHYKPTYERVRTFDGELEGLTDTRIYDHLEKDQAGKLLKTVEDFINEILRFNLRGVKEQSIAIWLGKTGK